MESPDTPSSSGEAGNQTDSSSQEYFDTASLFIDPEKSTGGGDVVKPEFGRAPGSLMEAIEDSDFILRCKSFGQQSFSVLIFEDDTISFVYHTPVEVLEVLKGDVKVGDTIEVTSGSGYLPGSVRDQITAENQGSFRGRYLHEPLSHYADEKAWGISENALIMEQGEEYVVFLKNIKRVDGLDLQLDYKFANGNKSVVQLKDDKASYIGEIEAPHDTYDPDKDIYATWYPLDEFIDLVKGSGTSQPIITGIKDNFKGSDEPIKWENRLSLIDQSWDKADVVLRCRAGKGGTISWYTYLDKTIPLIHDDYFFPTPVEVLEVYKGDAEESIEIQSPNGLIPYSLYEEQNNKLRQIEEAIDNGDIPEDQEVKKLKELNFKNQPLSTYTGEKYFVKTRSLNNNMLEEGKEYILFLTKGMEEIEKRGYYPTGTMGIVLIEGDTVFLDYRYDKALLTDPYKMKIQDFLNQLQQK